MSWFAKMIFDGGGDKNQNKSTDYFQKISKNLKYFACRLSNFLTSRSEEKLSKGAVLIEFAVCMPILIILLFYINDLVKIKRYYSQTEFVGQQMANILQNISRNRSSKAITLDDLKRACTLAWLSEPLTGNLEACTNIYYIQAGGQNSCEYEIWYCGIFQSSDVYLKVRKADFCKSFQALSERASFLFGQTHCSDCVLTGFQSGDQIPESMQMGGNTVIVAVELSETANGLPSCSSSSSTSPGKVACAWGIAMCGSQNSTWTKDEDIFSNKGYSNIQWGNDVDPSAIYPTLTMSEGGKIIIETQFRLNSGSAKTAFGLHLVNPPSKVPDNSRYFSSVVIFTPKPGLFSGTAPS